MLTFTQLTPRAIAIVAEGHFTATDIAPALERMSAILDATPQIDIFAEVRGSPSIAISTIIEELRHLPLLIRLVRQIERVGIVADAQWIRTISWIEGALIPGVHYEIYEPQDIAHARAWVLRDRSVAAGVSLVHVKTRTRRACSRRGAETQRCCLAAQRLRSIGSGRLRRREKCGRFAPTMTSLRLHASA